ncbi:MAG: DUF892 family protein [Beijerinckiaceae bacterium]
MKAMAGTSKVSRHLHANQQPREHPMATKAKPLEELFHEILKDIFFAEDQILKSRLKLAKAANLGELRNAYEKHRDATEGQAEGRTRCFPNSPRPRSINRRRRDSAMALPPARHSMKGF